MISFDSKYVTAKGEPLAPSTVPADWAKAIPDYCALLAQANGIHLLGGIFRIFGMGEQAFGRDALTWNSQPWRAAFNVPGYYLFVGENIFGDQYTFDPRQQQLLLMACEGGKMDPTPFRTVTALVEDIVVNKSIQGLDMNLLRAASQSGMRPGPAEHLSFSVPLICGGTANGDNLEVLDASAHLQILGQIAAQTRKLPAGAPIASFKGE